MGQVLALVTSRLGFDGFEFRVDSLGAQLRFTFCRFKVYAGFENLGPLGFRV